MVKKLELLVGASVSLVDDDVKHRLRNLKQGLPENPYRSVVYMSVKDQDGNSILMDRMSVKHSPTLIDQENDHVFPASFCLSGDRKDEAPFLTAIIERAERDSDWLSFIREKMIPDNIRSSCKDSVFVDRLLAAIAAQTDMIRGIEQATE